MAEIEIDRTDEERVEQVKQWINDYWKTIVLAIGLTGGALYGINNYKNSKKIALNEEATISAAIKEKLSAETVNLKAITDDITTLQSKNKTSSMAAISSFKLAKAFFEKGQFAEAIKQYDWVITNAPDPAMKDLAKIRKSRTLASDKKFDAAIKSINSLQSNSYKAETTLLKGDILLAQNKFDEAIKVYEGFPKKGLIPEQTFQQRIDLANIKKEKANL